MFKRFLCVVAGVLLACNERTAPETATAVPHPLGVVDSILPVEEQIRRFQEKLPQPLPTDLAGERSRDALVNTLVRALETSDTTAIRRLVVSAAEFIQLYYPYTDYTRPPYRQSPDIVWLLLQANSSKGITRTLDRFGSKRLGFKGYQCKADPVLQEQNRLWTECVLVTETARDLRLFGPILERAGRFKFLSYANDL
jgi:hypothetical protein